METYCTRPDCSQPINNFSELDDRSELQTAQQKYCNACGMPQILAGRYIPQKLLGKGGFGAAYLACDRHSTKLRPCVVKQFQPPNHFNEKTLKVAEELFTREAEALETLGNEHPQIPDLYAFFPWIVPEKGGEEKQFFYIVQEYIDGETLAEEVDQNGKFSEAEVREVLENMLPILQFVHEHNSIHRDIKPSNMIRDRAGKLYLLDFGAVKRVAGATTSNYSTGIYSMGFAPPEQMQGRQVYPSTDLYALAASCIRLATGTPIQELYDSYHNQWVWRKKADLSESLANILERMLRAAPKERFASAQAVLNALQEQDNSPVSENAPKVDTSEEARFSQPADWRSLLSVSKPAPDNSDQNVEAPSAKNWRSLLSVSKLAPDESDQDIEAPSEENWQPLSSKKLEPSTTPQSTESEVPSEENWQPLSSKRLESSTTSQSTESTAVQSQSNQTPPAITKENNDRKPQRKTPQFALWELLVSAGFTGLEGALLLIALTSLFSIPGISFGLWGMSMGGLIYAQWKRFIEKLDFLLIGGVTLAVVLLVPPLHTMPSAIVVVISIVASAGAISVTALIRLLYKLFSQ